MSARLQSLHEVVLNETIEQFLVKMVIVEPVVGGGWQLHDTLTGGIGRGGGWAVCGWREPEPPPRSLITGSKVPVNMQFHDAFRDIWRGSAFFFEG